MTGTAALPSLFLCATLVSASSAAAQAANARVVLVDPDWLLSGWVRLGARGGVSYMPRVPDYRVRDQTVLTLTTLAFDAGLVVALMVPD